jgi:hypothetical protein
MVWVTDEYGEIGFPCGWQWQWPQSNGYVKAAPNIGIGWKWGNQNKEFTSDLFPVRVSDITSLEVIFDMEVIATGHFNTSLDIWLTNDPYMTSDNISHEIMIWIDNHDMPHVNEDGKSFIIDGEEYILYQSTDFTYYQYCMFYKVEKSDSRFIGSLDINQFLEVLMSENIVKEEEYLIRLELINEIADGEGKTTIREFDIQCESTTSPTTSS